VKKILLGVSTVGVRKNRLEESLAEVVELGLTEIGVFMTGVAVPEREEAYRLIRRFLVGHTVRVPFVHARTDMKEEEYRFFEDELGTEWFNIHPLREWPLHYTYSKRLNGKILIENIEGGLTDEDLEGFGGICLDLSHLENYKYRLQTNVYRSIDTVLRSHPIRANHISAVYDTSHYDEYTKAQDFAVHFAEDLSNLDYVKRFPAEYFAPLVVLELQNSLIEQLALARHLSALTGIAVAGVAAPAQ
jgi:sugar phosphate isomerase/epimerase